MRKTLVKHLLIILGGVGCAHIFYQEEMGLNTLFFTLPLLILAFAQTYKSGPYNKEVAIAAVATFLSALAVVGNDSLLAKIMYWFSIILFLGFIKHPLLHFLPLVTGAAISNMVTVPWNIVRQWAKRTRSSNSLGFLIKKGVSWLIPLGLFTFFLLIYYLANDKFQGLVDSIIDFFFNSQGQSLAGEQVGLFFVGILVVGGVLLNNPFGNYLSDWQNQFSTNLSRIRNRKLPTYFSPIALKGRFKLSIITLTLLNALICIVNLTDLFYVWFSQRALSAVELSLYVHEGTNLLIFAILVAALVVLVIFRKNLNFFPNNEGLKKLAYIWIGQNIFMVFSVAIRNFQYLSNYGLTHKRIGVFVFLLIVLIGLVTLFLKIRDRKSHYFLWHRNSWAVFLILLVCSFINWNLLITRVNLQSNFIKHLDTHYLINELSNQNAYLLDRHEATLIQHSVLSSNKIKDRIQEKLRRAGSGRSIYSWNWPYYLNRRYQHNKRQK